MKNEKLRADIKRELSWPISTKKLAELLNRCYVALGELDTSMLPAEAQAGLALQRNEIDRLKQQLRAEGDRIAELNAKLGEQQSVPEWWEESLNKSLVLETERAINQRDKFLETGISTSGHGGSHDTCFAAIVRQHIAMLAAYRSAQEGK